MPAIIKNYCTHCNKPQINSNSPVKEKMQAKLIDASSRIASNTHIVRKTIKAHPLSSALIAVAVVSCFVAAGVLMGTGFGAIGVLFIGIGANAVLGGCLFVNHHRKKIEADEFKKNHAMNDATIQRIQGKNVCLVLESTFDHNGAVRLDKGPAKWEKKYPLVHVKVSNIDDVKKAIDEVSQYANIEVLWHSGHGSQNGLVLGSPAESIHLGNLDELKESYDKLSPTATIVYSACELAKGDFARRTSEVAERRVLASKIDIGRNSVRSDVVLKMKKEARFGIQVPRWGSKGRTPKEKVQNAACVIGFTFTPNIIGKHLKKSAMRVYDNGVLQDVTTRTVVV